MKINNNDKKVILLGNYYDKRFGTNYGGNVWDKRGICPAITTLQGGGRTPSIIITMGTRNERHKGKCDD